MPIRVKRDRAPAAKEPWQRNPQNFKHDFPSSKTETNLYEITF